MALNDAEEKELKDKLAAAEKVSADAKAELEKAKKPPEKTKEELEKERKEKEDKESDLDDKVKKQKKSEEDAKGESKRLENALKFNLEIKEFVESNKDILPSDVADIIKAADAEKYDNAADKASAIRTSVIKTFFAVQANIDALTPKQKTQLEDYLKLTKSGREEKSEFIFENIFEPALEMVKKLKKADELGKSRAGISSGTKAGDDYKNKLINGSKKTYLGEKGDK